MTPSEGSAKYEDRAPDDFKLFAQTDYFWRCKALDLKAAAATLRAKPGIGDVALMLAGMALENIIKAVLAKQGMIKLKGEGQDRQLDKMVACHKLDRLIDNAEIEVDDDQRRTLELLSEHVEWKGRYPTPIKAQCLSDRHKKGMQRQRQVGWDPDLWPAFLDLFALAEKRLKE
jgi:hypothetical protein